MSRTPQKPTQRLLYDPEKFYCNDHESKASYFCLQPDLQTKKRIACGECMLEGCHQNHQYIKIQDLKQQLMIIQKNQNVLPKGIIDMKEEMNQFYQNVKEQFITKFDNWFKELMLQFDKKTNPSTHIQNILKDEDLIETISKEQYALIMRMQDPQMYQKFLPQPMESQEEDLIRITMSNIQKQVTNLTEKCFTPFLQGISELEQEVKEQMLRDHEKAMEQNRLLNMKKHIEFQAHNTLVKVIEDLGDGLIATGGGDKKIRIFDLNSVSDPCLCVLQGHRGTVNSILYLSENQMASCGDDNQIIIWQKIKAQPNPTADYLQQKSAKAIGFRPKNFLTGHNDFINKILRLNNELLISCSNDSTIKIWDFQHSTIKEDFIQSHEGPITDILKFNKQVLISGGADSKIKIWSIKKGLVCKTLEGHQSDVTSLTDVDIEHIASSSLDNRIIIWNIKQFECKFILEGHSSSVWKVLRIDNEYIASCSHDKSVRIWKISENEANSVKEYRDRNAYYSSLLYLDSTLLAGCTDGYIVQWVG